MFGTILISVCTVMHIYVFWRAASVPFVDRHVPRKILIGAGVILWAIFFFGRVIGHGGTGVLAGTLEFLGMNWMGVLFLTFIPLLAIDLVTLFGFLMPRLSPSLRGWALLVGVVLSVIALFQGLRPPVIRKIRSGPSRPSRCYGRNSARRPVRYAPRFAARRALAGGSDRPGKGAAARSCGFTRRHLRRAWST